MLNISDLKGYLLKEQKKIEELNGYGYVLYHEKSGARVLLVDNDDDNKVFSIAFRTPPSDDTGVAHILEHSVLCGSEKFPSKDPFVELAKGSLNTFLNAMTYPDKTVYPIASCNAKDYHNLMHVYLDAVFYPNIYKKEEILQQEGWHYEMEDADAELKFNGVVYNEMKGVFSNPDALLERKIQAALLKDTPYAFESGGDPDAIPELTREGFLGFHSKYYHPSNSYIYLYGDVDFQEELAFLDREYLSRFDKKEVDSRIALQQPFAQPMTLEDTYSVSGEEEREDGVFLSYNVVTGDNTDQEEMLALQILEYVLFSMPGAPVQKALIDAGIGKEIDSFFDAGIQQPVFSITAKNVEKGKEAVFRETVEQALREQIQKGLNRKAILSAINNFEFKYREANFGRYPKGLIYGLNFLNTWLYGDERALELSDSLTPLMALKKKVETGYFEELVESRLLKNPHKAFVNLYPEMGKNEKMDEKLKKQLAKVKAGLDKKQLAYLAEQTKKLKAFQETPSTREEVEKIPLLELSDIKKEALPYKNEEGVIGELPVVMHKYHTNGIVYMDFCFDSSELPEELIPYATLLVELFRYMDTEKRSYNELATEINLKIGGISFQTGVYPLLWKKDGFRPFFSIKMKCLEEQVADGMELMEEILFRTKFDDGKRLKEILSELRTKMDSRIPSTGHVYAANRALSYVDPMMQYKDMAEGIDFYEFVKRTDEDFENRQAVLLENLLQASRCIFRKENLTVSLTGEFSFKSLLEGRFRAFGRKLYEEPCVKSVPVLCPQKKKEGFAAASKVQYVAAAGSFEREGQKYTGALNVLKTIFSYDYLWVNVRVTGGAYGCMCGFSRNGYGYFTSYRDPNLEKTLAVYRGAAEYVRSFDVDDRDMLKYIIGTVSAMDQPLEPSALGERSFLAYLSGMSYEMAQKEREQVLGTNQETIRKLAPYMEALMEADTVCAIGNDKTIREADMFDTVRNLTKISEETR
ncbi:MAG: insulinase family protein [Eubacteriales bacterium]|nr:insulinase family protein [Eubacteriales bacterium]